LESDLKEPESVLAAGVGTSTGLLG
jgi:hypothetical protein